MTHDHIILHNYPQSPVAEKVRVGLGIKGLSWSSAEIPRLPPKPLLLPLTGGYRRTPVMQIGADVYCDSQCILNELDRRFPTKEFFPTKDSGFLWMLGRLIDGDLFTYTVKIVLGSGVANLPPEFARDRGRLYLGPDWANELLKANNDLSHLVVQMRAYLSAINDQLDDGRLFLAGSDPAALDAHLYHLIWFLRGRWDQGPTFLNQFSNLNRWEDAVKAIGHGQSTPISGQEALAIATAASPRRLTATAHDPQELILGQIVRIIPDADTGEDPVTGGLVSLGENQVALSIESQDLGSIQVHFPRSGYKIFPV
ncbi:MAG: glutathione S-transferase [Paracoccaceae bacterium]|jgi:glutathione S-transferase